MNKKFLSAILFGALMVTSTGTFVSCKDYDDDIDNLQEQIDKLATKEDMTSQIATLQAALTAAAKDASDAITKATAAEAAAKAAGDTAAEAKAAADKAVAEAKAESIAAVKAEIETLKKELEASTESALSEMRKEVEAATKKVEDIVGKIADMVTSVELVVSQYGMIDNQYSWGKTLGFMTAIEKENTFGKGLPGEMTFTKGTQVQTGDSFIIRVSPTNAVVTPEMVSLIDGEGNVMDDFLTVESVEPYNEQILGFPTTPQETRATSASGLWKVTVALKNYNPETWNAATMVQTGPNTYQYKRFAVEVNNTLSTASTREVLSSFDLQLDKKEFKPVGELNYWVGAKNVTTIRNRYATTESIDDGGLNITTGKEELRWTDITDPRTYVKRNGNGTVASDANAEQANATLNDNRSSLTYIYPAVQGTPFTVSIDKIGNTVIDDKEAPSQVKGMYVVLDTRNAIESEPSEINAWKGYDIKGINEVVAGTSTKITISGANTINDIIGFRVYAVNYDGTLVDPDGRAFYVRLGDTAADWNATATTVMAGIAAPTAVTSGKYNVSLTKLTGAATAAWATDECENEDKPAFDFAIYKSDNTELYSTAKTYTAAALRAIKFQDAAYIRTTPKCASWLDYKDDKTYNGVLTIKNANDFVLATIKVSMTKKLPTTMPEGYSLKDKQVINGIYNCYMIADKWAASQANQGEMPIENLINWGKGDATNGANYIVKFAESADDANNDGKKETLSPAGNGKIVVTKGYVDNKTEHATSVFYNYGKISTETVDENNKVVDYMVAGDSFKTVYCCFYKKEVHTWDWATRAQLGGDYNALKDPKDPSQGYKANPLSTTLTYGEDGKGAYNAFIFGKNAIDGEFSKLLSNVYASSLKVKSAKLISDATQKEDYFSVSTDLQFTAIKKDLGSNPKENVPSTLIINCKDSYDHDVVITLKMTVTPRK